MAPLRTARIVAASLEVHCPYCGEPVPEPSSGSDVWEIRQIQEGATANEGARTCNSCEKQFRIATQAKAQIDG